MKRRFAFFVAAFGLLLVLLLVTSTTSGAALPVGSEVALRPVKEGARTAYRNPFLPIVDFLVDDGTIEYQFGLNTQGHGLVLLGLNRFTLNPGEYPLLLTEISVLFPDPVRAHIDLTGRDVDLLVYRDTSGSGQPGNASKIYQSTVQVQTLSPNFSVYPVNIPIQGPGDIYIGFSNIYDHGGTVLYSYPFGLDQGQSQQRSWIIGNYNGSDPNFNDLSNNQLVSLIDNMGFSYIGNFLIRGSGEVGATPNPTQTPTQTPTPLPSVTRPPAYVLYDQYDHISPIYATNSQQYEPYYEIFTDYLADDFVVPAGQIWYLDEVDVAGRIEGGMGSVESFNVIVYTSGGTVPGNPVYTAMNVPYTLQGAGEYHIPLSTPATLSAGTYWVMVQANLSWSTGGQFMWYNRGARSYNQAAWYNPGEGWGTNCTESWGTRWMCTGDAGEPDQVWRLLGTIFGGPTTVPTNTATRTPTMPPVTNTPTSTNTAQSVLVGHVTWQGITQPDARNNGITATLKLCVGGVPQIHNISTDASGIFTVTSGLVDGSYNWQTKGVRNLAGAGSLTVAGGTSNQEMGAMPAGDSNDDNSVNAVDFSILRSTFGTGNDLRADFNRDGIVGSTDFSLLRGNFGQGGAALTCP